MRIFGFKLLSILWLVNFILGSPVEYHKNSHTSIIADETKHFNHHHSTIDNSDFIPIIPSQIDPHPIISSFHSDPHLNPIDLFSSLYHNQHHFSTLRPFAIRHISSTRASTRQQQQYVTSTQAPSTFDPSILGSGDFDVMRGGTFYSEGEKEHFGSGSEFYDSNAGQPFLLPFNRPKHQKPQTFSDNPFANFKDFADITSGADISDFSNLILIYANGNTTKSKPRNIFELLNEQSDLKYHDETADIFSTSSPIKTTKLSKFKMKLRSKELKQKEYPKKKKKNENKMQIEKNKDEKSSVDYVDPLVADS